MYDANEFGQNRPIDCMKMCKRNPKCEVSSSFLMVSGQNCHWQKFSQGFYFYDGHKKACTLYSNVDDEYFQGHFCAEAKHKTRQEVNDKQTCEVHMNIIVLISKFASQQIRMCHFTKFTYSYAGRKCKYDCQWYEDDSLQLRKLIHFNDPFLR